MTWMDLSRFTAADIDSLVRLGSRERQQG